MATLRETHRSGADLEGDARVYILDSSSAARLGETTVRLSKLTQKPGPPPQGQVSSAPPALTMQGQVPTSGLATRQACTRHQDEATLSQLAYPQAPPQNFEVPRGSHMERV